MSKNLKIMLQISLLSGVMMVTGCASKQIASPSTVSSAKQALLNAQQADVIRFAPLDMRIAQEKIEAAQDAFRTMDYVNADRLAQEALVTVQLAEAKAAKEKLKASTGDLQDTLHVLKRETSN
ncbi:MAG: DUF4398 domain-containing protein [Moraxellaceae bacterium]|nr:DUF4398 domain-containing protein [Moraxellaceae bacterium]